MALFSFHFLQTAFFLANWIGWPQHIAWTLVIHFLFQMVYFLAGGFANTAEEQLGWGWQTLVTFIGILNSVMLHLLTYKIRNPKFLQFKSAETQNWYTFILSLAAFVGGQLLYAYFPPLATSSSGAAALGLMGTLVISVFVIVCLWYALRRWNFAFFGHWIWMTIVSQALFYLSLSGLDELWTAMAAGGAPILIGAIYFIFSRQANGIEL